MAVARGQVIIAPSTDVRTKDELNNIQIESGLFYCTESVTVQAISETGSLDVSHTDTKWAVTCISTETQNNVHCLMQLWIPCSGRPEYTFIRTSTLDSEEYSDFSVLATADYLKTHAITTNQSTPTKLMIQETQPAIESGKTIIWVDTSS